MEKEVYELVGRFVRLECSLSFPGSSVVPDVPATWYMVDGDNYIDVSQLDNVQLTSNGPQYVLLFESVSLEDTSRYACAIVENEMRIVEEFTQLIVFESEKISLILQLLFYYNLQIKLTLVMILAD